MIGLLNTASTVLGGLSGGSAVPGVGGGEAPSSATATSSSGGTFTTGAMSRSAGLDPMWLIAVGLAALAVIVVTSKGRRT